VQKHNRCLRFEQLILPHLDAAYNLARWLTHNDQDAQDMVQEACLRAYRFLPDFRGENSRAWLLAIVRNTCYTWLHRQHPNEIFDEKMYEMESDALDPETIYIHFIDQEKVQAAIKALPLPLREVTVLRELEELSYKEISAIAHIPLGTVMSRLSHARKRLQHELAYKENEETQP
jgi:RNA polymerase sigma factor (sigma-70 family)